MTTTPTAYLARLGGARQLYVWLYEDAAKMLPPPQEGEGMVPLQSHASVADVAKALGWSRSVVRCEMVRLVNFGWMRGRRAPRWLGQRQGGALHLMADIAAEDQTGVVGLVSDKVLQVEKPAEKQREPLRTDGRGSNRKWDPNDDGGW